MGFGDRTDFTKDRKSNPGPAQYEGDTGNLLGKAGPAVSSLFNTLVHNLKET